MTKTLSSSGDRKVYLTAVIDDVRIDSKLHAAMKFHKYQALGNAYLVLELDRSRIPSTDLLRGLCDRHFGIGSDGVLFADPGSTAGLVLRIFNPDGSEAEKSGNGLRIFARYLWDTQQVVDEPFEVVTKGGTVRCEVRRDGSEIVVAMGIARFQSTKIPVVGPIREVIDEEITIADKKLRFTAVTVGNPHCVIYTDDATPALAAQFGPLLERHENFPNRTNVQFVTVIDRKRIRIEIWERGAGYTLASGSSSCAAAAASVRLGLCDSDITVMMPGGELSITVAKDFSIRMLGPASKVAEGWLAEEFLAKFNG